MSGPEPCGRAGSLGVSGISRASRPASCSRRPPGRFKPTLNARPWRATSSRRRAVTTAVRADDVRVLDAAGPGDVDDELLGHPAGPAGEHHDAVAEPGGLAHVVGDEQDRAAGLLPDALELVVHDVAGHGVEGAEGLVHEEHLALLGQGPGQGDPLAHAAGELVGLAVGEAAELDEVEQLGGAAPALGLGDAAELERQLDVATDAEPGEQRRVLEHDGRAARALRRCRWWARRGRPRG